MTDQINGMPFWQITFDAQGDPDPATTPTVISEIVGEQLTDVIMFSHGWNNSQASARSLYDGWFGLLAGQLVDAKPGTKVGAVGIFWPSQMWMDEPIPDFSPAAQVGAAGAPGGGVAGVQKQAGAVAAVPTLDDATLAALKAGFPAATKQLDAMAALLHQPETTENLTKFKAELSSFVKATAVPSGDGKAAGDPGNGVPGMLAKDPTQLFQDFTDALVGVGVDVNTGGGGVAGIGDVLHGLWNGAKEALRQATYWQMKNRAGVVGAAGLGPFVGNLCAADQQARPAGSTGVRVHLVGHSFGARLVSFSLTGLPAGTPGLLKSITLLEGAFSHFAFANPSRFGPGALAGLQASIDGPLTICFSSFDQAVGQFYPLASMASGSDLADAQSPTYRWDGMGHDGAQESSQSNAFLQAAATKPSYPFTDGGILNIDSSAFVNRGGPPSGAHSDIVHPELSWVVLKASKIVA